MQEDYPLIGNYCFRLKVYGHELRVTYKFSPFADIDNVKCYLKENKDCFHPVHFEFRGKTASETGYRSHFTFLDRIGDDPNAYAKEGAEHLYQELKKTHPQLFQPQQLKMF